LIKESGIVEEIKEELALVSIKRSEMCAQCPQEGHCRLISEQGIRQVWAVNLAGAKPGEKVTLGIGEKKLLKASLVFYIIPLLALFLGAGLGKWISKTGYQFPIEGMLGKTINNLLFSADNPSLILGGVFLLVSFLGIWLWNQRKLKQSEFRPRVLEVLRDGEE